MIFLNGVTGSLGRYLLEYVEERGTPYTVLKTRLEQAHLLEDELKQVPLEAIGNSVCLLHLAALVPVTVCEKNQDLAYKTNVVWTAEYVKQFIRWAGKSEKEVKIIYVSSGHVYKAFHKPAKTDETRDVFPRSVYAKTKLQAETALLALSQKLNFELCIPRVFGLLAPIQPPQFVLQGLIRRAFEKDFTNIQGLESVRDYLDARDVARILLALRGHSFCGVVNVCSGTGIAIADLLACIVREIYPREAEQIISNFQPAPGRPDGVPYLVGDNVLLSQILAGPARTTPVKQTVQDALRVYER